ncbi:hypothetical protein ACJ3XI_03300 [Litorimonas sp. RW-G-Af-16]|uniref:hypothetical protein n=1 Tax=Litorimonas sp. RW-G-Af-16 TaxID=3241168 RepID=UPI00390C66B3
METSANFEALQIIGAIIQCAALLAIIYGLFRLARKKPVFRAILIGFMIIATLLIIGAYFIFKDMGKGWAL